MRHYLIIIFCIALLAGCGGKAEKITGAAVQDAEGGAKGNGMEENLDNSDSPETQAEKSSEEFAEQKAEIALRGKCTWPDSKGVVRDFDENGNKEVHRPICFGELKILNYGCTDGKVTSSIETCLNGCETDGYAARCK